MSQSTSAQDLTSSRLLAKNTLWNLLGLGAPLLAALVAIPLLIKGTGTERFGILTLTWVVIGYFSIFDLGIGRALTQLVARKLGTDQTDEIPSVIWTGLALMLVLGLIGAMVVLLLTPSLVFRLLNIPPQLRGETLSAFYLLAATIPVVIGTAGLRGILEAYQRFGIISAIRIPMGLFYFYRPPHGTTFLLKS